MIVFTNGCFDILHPGHFNLLTYCKKLAGPKGKLIVAIDEDDKVIIDKGITRPIYDVHERAKALLALQSESGPIVNVVEFFQTNQMLKHIMMKHQPDIIVKGSDWKDKYVVNIPSAEVLYFDRLDEYSTTDVIRRILDRNKPL